MSEKIQYFQQDSTIASRFQTPIEFRHMKQDACTGEIDSGAPESISPVRASLLTNFYNSVLQDIDVIRHSMPFPEITQTQEQHIPVSKAIEDSTGESNEIPIYENTINSKELVNDGSDRSKDDSEVQKTLLRNQDHRELENLLAEEEVPGGIPDCGYGDSGYTIAMTNEEPPGLGIGGSGINQENNEYVWNLLKKDDSKAFMEWKYLLTPEQRANVYKGLDDDHKNMLNVATSGWVRKEARDNIDKGVLDAFSEFGKDLNIIPKIAIEDDPLKKARLGAHEYAELMDELQVKCNLIGAQCSRLQHSQEDGTAYVKTIRDGAAGCGEFASSLSDTYSSLFADQSYPGNNPRNQKNGGVPLDCYRILARGPANANHAAAVIVING